MVSHADGHDDAAVPRASRWYRRHLGPAWRPATDPEVRRRLAGRTVLVTGASSGIGRATAIALGRAGCHVIGLARRDAELSILAGMLADIGAGSTMINCDLADPGSVDRAVTGLAERRIDALINNAGLSLHRRIDRARDPADDLRRSVAVNLEGPARLAVGLLPSMGRHGSGHLVTVGSVSALVPTAGWAAYAATKAGFDGWTRAVAAEVRGAGITVSTVHLPLVLTPMSAPTYRTRWGLTADQAASVLLAVLVRRPRLLAPWWARVAGVVGMLAPQVPEALAGRR